jgi:predicted phosphoadenosine phosphosulfate sulfurtransferase
MAVQEKVNRYVSEWVQKGYDGDIPDEVPDDLMKLGLAPSYKAIAICLLQNDLNLYGLGFSKKVSQWYSAYKKVEIEQRNK